MISSGGGPSSRGGEGNVADEDWAVISDPFTMGPFVRVGMCGGVEGVRLGSCVYVCV